VDAELQQVDLAGIRTEIDQAQRLATTLARGIPGAARLQ
jgi:hypothetical protein